MTLSEEWFDRYIRDHGHDPGEVEPDLGIEKRPDRLIGWNGVEVVCEVKQFDNDPFGDDWNGQPRTMDMKAALNPVRRAVSYAAEQLKPLAGRGMPLVVVIANPNGMPVPFSSEEIIWALYGDPVWKITIDEETGAPVGETEYGADRNGQIRNRHQYLSAAVALCRRTLAQDWSDALWARLKDENHFDPVGDPEGASRVTTLAVEEMHAAEERGDIPAGDYLYSDVFVTMSAEAEPLPANVFDGPRDSRWEFDAATSAYRRVRNPQAD
jgi:hypothetical protein